ncbi:urea ABC transporter substrate-binding protein [Cerasicoccus fimbriatus]|uniref:urea ABC transporter substrate-binding protein n=1 Tax=Cerasicoccus fimbriatus TaxID=3014554 RepID=UPI0022B5E481|nr:urea ABC transporter substrate-binding protein [Cerasicoccus sp. TK19100]
MTRTILLSWLALALLAFSGCGDQKKEETVKVGILHSSTGTMANSEKPVIDAVQLAINEINDSNYLPGIRLEPVVRDGQSKERVFAKQAEDLLNDENVAVIFGGWTSASRKAMIPVLEKNDGLLFYPVQYEGAESSPNVVYLGAAPNQQIIPAVYWAMKDKGANRFYLVGSDYVFPRTANEVIKDQVRALGGEIVGERYLQLGSEDTDEVAQEILDMKPDFILNTINGDTNGAFIHSLREAGITSDAIPTISFSIDENMLDRMGVRKRLLEGDYAASNYLQSIPTRENRAFVKKYQNAYGKDATTTDAIVAAYSGVYLWAEAVKHASENKDVIPVEATSAKAVREHIGNRSFQSPGGMVFIDPQNQHLYKTARIGRITNEGQFEIEWESDAPVRPAPYPMFRPMEAWDEYLAMLKQGWNGEWSAPAQ